VSSTGTLALEVRPVWQRDERSLVKVADMMDGLTEDECGIVATKSRLRVWWLTHVNGYVVCAMRLEPKETLWGTVHLVPRWQLSVSSRFGARRRG